MRSTGRDRLEEQCRKLAKSQILSTPRRGRAGSKARHACPKLHATLLPWRNSIVHSRCTARRRLCARYFLPRKFATVILVFRSLLGFDVEPRQLCEAMNVTLTR